MEWVPPFMVGAAAAVAGEVAVGILLYAGPGLMRSLSVVLVIEVGALSVGLWSAPGPGEDLIERMRRRWLLCLLSFVAAAMFGTTWTVLQDLGRGAVGQGFGLAVLGALPLYACGGVLGGMETAARADPRGPRRGPGASAALGAAVGFGLTGLMLPRSPMPSSLLVACLVLLSFGGMVYGAVLASTQGVEEAPADAVADTPADSLEDHPEGPEAVVVVDDEDGTDG
jgi:hypothetical protein